MAKPGVLPSACIPDKCDVILCKVSGEMVSFLEIDTFRRMLTKQRKTVTIQFSRYRSDTNLQLHTHIHEPAFIGAVGVNISVERQGNTAVTEDGGKSFDVESLLCGIGRKCVAELVIIMIFHIGST